MNSKCVQWSPSIATSDVGLFAQWMIASSGFSVVSVLHIYNADLVATMSIELHNTLTAWYRY